MNESGPDEIEVGRIFGPNSRVRRTINYLCDRVKVS